MIVTETITIRGVEYKRTSSDSNKYIERDGVQYEDAVDTLDSENVYTETDINIPTEEELAAMASIDSSLEEEV